MKKVSAILLALIFLFTSANLSAFAIIPGEDAVPSASSLTYGELQEMYLEHLSNQQISISIGTPEYYQYAQTQIYGDTDPVLASHPFYSQIHAYLIEYSALYQDYLYGISALQQNTAAGEQLIAQFSTDNPCLQYNAAAQKLDFVLNGAFLSKTLAQSKAENEAKYALADQLVPQNTATASAANYTYSPSAAIQYARQYAYSHNVSYPSFISQGVDCTNFISQCLHAGGIPMAGTGIMPGAHSVSNQWYCMPSLSDPASFSRTFSWSVAEDFYTYMRVQAIQWRIVGTVDEVIQYCQPGDIVQFMSRETNRVHHSTIISKKTAGEAYYCAHSVPAKDEKVSQKFKESQERFIILSFRNLPSTGGVSLDTCEPCDDQVPSTTSVEFCDASLDCVVECPNHNGRHDAEKYVYTYDIVCTRHGTVVGTKYETVYICVPE